MRSITILDDIRAYEVRDAEAAFLQLRDEAKRIGAKGVLTDADANRVLGLMKRARITRSHFAAMVEQTAAHPESPHST
jgi:hypothetical protein